MTTAPSKANPWPTPLPHTSRAWAAASPKAALIEKEFPLPSQLEPYEVLLQVMACGICHSDIHLINNDWGISSYPLVAGHEVLGKVIAGGNAVTSLKSGDVVGVGWQRRSCHQCEHCLSARENLCSESGATCVGHQGGYADYHVTDARFCFLMPESLRRPEAAPLLCGGATVFSPLCEFMNNPQPWAGRVGVVGAGGLGHLAIKMAKAMGYEVTAFSSSASKQQELLEMGAHNVVSSTDERQIQKVGRRLDLVISTVNVNLPWRAFVRTLRADGTLCFVGVPPADLQIGIIELLSGRLRIAASPIAGRARIHEMLQFCDRHRIAATSEIFPMDDVNEALAKAGKNQVHYRAVLVR